MCRLIAIVQPENKDAAELALRQFGILAENGAVPHDDHSGHKDGWGVAAYDTGTLTFFDKEPLSAFENKKFEASVNKIGVLDPSLILGHLRKASLGGNKIENTQPYRFENYAFAHNGTLRGHEKLILDPRYAAVRKGETDSEVIFLWLLQTIEKNKSFRDGFLDAVKQLRTMEYTALNILMSDGKTLLAMREANEKNSDVQRLDLCDRYYSLLQGKDVSGVTRLICSEKLSMPNIVWTEIPNHTVLAIDIESGKEELIRL